MLCVMNDLERRNQVAIGALNQRGGRMLSLVDLLEAGTVGLDMAAEMACLAAGGGSFLTAAGPGGVGKMRGDQGRRLNDGAAPGAGLAGGRHGRI